MILNRLNYTGSDDIGSIIKIMNDDYPHVDIRDILQKLILAEIISVQKKTVSMIQRCHQ